MQYGNRTSFHPPTVYDLKRAPAEVQAWFQMYVLGFRGFWNGLVRHRLDEWQKPRVSCDTLAEVEDSVLQYRSAGGTPAEEQPGRCIINCAVAIECAHPD